MEKYQRGGSGSTGKGNRPEENKPHRNSQQPKEVDPVEESSEPARAHSPLKEDVYIQYKQNVINLGNSWPDIVKELDGTIKDEPLKLAVQICLMKRLNIQLPAVEVEALMSSYAKCRTLK